MDLRKLWSVKRKPTTETAVEEARAILERDRPAEALEYLRDSGFAETPEAVVLARHIVYKHPGISQSLLGQPFLDPIWSQCHACGFLWVEPLSHGSDPLKGLQCGSCGRVFCASCISSLEERACPCGGAFHKIVDVHGRVRTDSDSMTYDDGEPEWPVEPPTDSERDSALLFGLEERIPVAVDPTLKWTALAPSGDRLRWAETLIDIGLDYHAQQMLDGMDESETRSATAKWLRARLLIVKLTRARERSRRVIGAGLSRLIAETPARIKALLEEAMEQDPSAGGVWLTAAEFYLDVAEPPDAARAAACAERARALLGDRDRVLLAIGRAWRATGHPDEAIAALSTVSTDSTERSRASEEKEAAEMERLAQLSAPDPVSSWRFGKQLISAKEMDRARQIFEHLVAELPDRPEGYCGLAQITFLRTDLPTRVRLTRAHELCTKALTCSPEFAPAHEFMGTLLRTAGWSGIELSSPLTAIGHFRRALELDSRSDVALAALADDCIERRDAHQAFELLERAAVMGTSIDGVFFKLAVFYQAMRQPEKQQEAYRRAKALAPRTELADDAKNRILEICGFEY